MNDLRGNSAPKELKSGIRNKLVGAILVAAAVCTAGVFFLTSTTTAPAQPLVAKHGPDAVQTTVMH